MKNHRSIRQKIVTTFCALSILSTQAFIAHPALAAKNQNTIDPVIINNILTDLQYAQKQNSELLGRIEVLEHKLNKTEQQLTELQEKLNTDTKSPSDTLPSSSLNLTSTVDSELNAQKPTTISAEDADLLLRSADNLFKIKAYQPAKSAYLSYTKNFIHHPGFISALINLGYSQQALEENRDALDTFNQALEHPELPTERLPELLLVTAQLYEKTNAADSADLLYKNLINNFPNTKEAAAAKAAQKT